MAVFALRIAVPTSAAIWVLLYGVGLKTQQVVQDILWLLQL